MVNQFLVFFKEINQVCVVVTWSIYQNDELTIYLYKALKRKISCLSQIFNTTKTFWESE